MYQNKAKEIRMVNTDSNMVNTHQHTQNVPHYYQPYTSAEYAVVTATHTRLILIQCHTMCDKE
mgnify:CR=1 FL=1